MDSLVYVTEIVNLNSVLFLFKLLTIAVSLYETACLVYIVLSWFPGARNSRFGYILHQICNPYLSLFRRLNLRVGPIDFSPAVAIAALVLVSGIFSNIAAYGAIKIGRLLSSLLQICWSLVSSVITVFNIFLVIRLVVHLAGKDFSLDLWRTLDRIIAPVQTRVSSILFGNRFKTYRIQLACTLGVSILIQILGSWLTGLIAALLVQLPF